MRKLYTFTLGFLILLSLATGASAVVTDKAVSATEDMLAFTGNSSDEYSNSTLSVYAAHYYINDTMQDTYLSFHYTVTNETDAVIQEYEGYKSIDNNSLIVDKTLSSGRLSVPKFTVYNKTVEPNTQQNISIDLYWTGNNFIKGYHPTNPVYGNQVTVVTIKAKEATLTGSVTGEDFNIDASTFTPYVINNENMQYLSCIIARYKVLMVQTNKPT